MEMALTPGLGPLSSSGHTENCWSKGKNLQTCGRCDNGGSILPPCPGLDLLVLTLLGATSGLLTSQLNMACSALSLSPAVWSKTEEKG